MPTLVQQRPGAIALQGCVDFDSVVAIAELGQQYIHPKSSLVINLAALTGGDSSGLALMTKWLRYAKKQHCQLTFSHIPAWLQDIARSCHVLTLLPQEE